MRADLNIAEIPFDSGNIKYRYTRYMSPDGTKWVRHGLFVAYHPNGAVASEGNYVDGAEHGLWRDYHVNGQLAAEGNYEARQEVGEWRYWNSDGSHSTERSE
jgi:antitoxin component YwqK of YwqJK toxin-antitoxin module